MNYRGIGVYSKIIESLKDWCRSQNMFEHLLNVYNENASAIKVYKKVGFKKHLINMRIGS
ncbi:GNAT family N-acetyltransferase [Flavobacterium urumqiense]|uniref:GNAT family N-acetyltransferase n=1 Tax=Flavobacterium urumqiense TaxID=935224 RepID=UPI001FC966AD|nr:GNAT family N-acetyltransferase [Flavobacterium urumqiense]